MSESAQIIAKASTDAGLNPLEVAMRWLVHHSKLNVKANDGIILGCSSLRQLKDNLDYLEKPPLPNELVDVLEQAWKVAKPDCDDYWQGNLEYGYDTQEVLYGRK